MSTSKAQQSTAELHAAIYTTQTLLKQAADVIERNMNSLAEAHTRNGIIDDTEVQASIESDADLIAELRAAALPWDQRHKSTERPPKRVHKFTPEQVAAVRADLQGAMRAHGVDTQSTDITQTFEGLPMRKLKVLLTAGWTINGVSIERTVEDVTVRGAVTTGGMVLWWNPPAGQAVPETSFGDMAAPVQEPVGEWAESRSGSDDAKRIAWKPGYVVSAKVGDKIYATPAAQPATCTWTKSADPHMPDTFDATCGVVWTFSDGGPAENDVRFCPKCGSKVVEGTT